MMICGYTTYHIASHGLGRGRRLQACVPSAPSTSPGMTLSLPMPERWIVRVSGNEYGPVDLETLLEWKREGRLLAANEIRAEAGTTWSSAGSIPGLFTPPPLPARSGHPLTLRRTFAKIMRDSFCIYRSAFVPFLAITFLASLPFLAWELTSPAYGIFPHGGSGATPGNIVALLALIAVVVIWPIFLAAIQIATLEVLNGRGVRLRELVSRAIKFFGRFAPLSLIVYGSYLLWTIPLLVAVDLARSEPTLGTIALTLALLALQVMMVSRLFINFLFWQQSAVVSNLSGPAAIRESKTLARSSRRPRRIDRPLWRGALLASLWFAVVLALSCAAGVPIVISRMGEVTTVEQMFALLQNMSAPTRPDIPLIVSAVVTSLLHALVRPFFAIAFVLLYFDARADFSEEELAALKEE